MQEFFSASRLLRTIHGPESIEEQALSLCDMSARRTGSALAVFYRIPAGRKSPKWAYQHASVGSLAAVERLSLDLEEYELILELDRALVQNDRTGPFPGLLLHGDARSALAVKVAGPVFHGILILNHTVPFHYDGDALRFVEELTSLLEFSPGGNHV